MIDYFFVFKPKKKAAFPATFRKRCLINYIVSTLSIDTSEEIGHVDLLVDHCTKF